MIEAIKKEIWIPIKDYERFIQDLKKLKGE